MLGVAIEIKVGVMVKIRCWFGFANAISMVR